MFVYGSLHHVPKKQPAQYCDEFSYRFNRRKEEPQLFEETTKSLLRGIDVTYEKRTADEVSGS